MLPVERHIRIRSLGTLDQNGIDKLQLGDQSSGVAQRQGLQDASGTRFESTGTPFHRQGVLLLALAAPGWMVGLNGFYQVSRIVTIKVAISKVQSGQTGGIIGRRQEILEEVGRYVIVTLFRARRRARSRRVQWIVTNLEGMEIGGLLLSQFGQECGHNGRVDDIF